VGYRYTTILLRRKMSETSNQQVTIKVQYKEDLRRFAFPRNGSFFDLEKILRNIFSFPSIPLVIKYQDDETDWVTCSSDAELAAAFGFLTPNGILKLLIPFELPSPVPTEAVPVSTLNANVAAPPALLSAPTPAVAPPCAAWKGVRLGWKEQKQNWKAQKKCQWQNWTPEERAAWIQRREAWKNQCKLEKENMKGEKKNWKCEKKCEKKNWKGEKKDWKCERKNWNCDKKDWKCGERKMWKQQNRWNGCGNQVGQCAPSAPPISSNLNDVIQFECRLGCPSKWQARFVKHVTAADGAVFGAGTLFTKTWRFRNDSNEAWPVGSKILFVGKNSDQMGGPNELEVGRVVEPGQEVDVSVPLVAPSQPGSYVGFWRMADPSGKRFGQRVRVQIQVPGSDTSSSSSSEEAEATTPVPVFPKNEETKSGLYPSLSQPAGLFAQLQAMGFTDQALNLRLARKHDGDIVKIVKKLMKRQKRESLAAQRSARNV